MIQAIDRRFEKPKNIPFNAMVDNYGFNSCRQPIAISFFTVFCIQSVFYTLSAVRVLYLVHVLYPVRSPQSAFYTDCSKFNPSRAGSPRVIPG